MNTRHGGIFLAAAFSAAAAAATAAPPASGAIVPQNYAVNGTFGDGGSFAGSFGYDPVANAYFDPLQDYGFFAITTTLGSQGIANQYIADINNPPPVGYDDTNSGPTQLYIEGGGHFADWTFELDWKTPLNAAGGGLLQPLTGGSETYNDFIDNLYPTRQVRSGFVQRLPANASVYAMGLDAPRGLKFGPDGALYVAEAGTGGTTSTAGACTQVPAPIGPYTGGLSGRISKLTAGQRTTVAAGFPSAQDAQGDLLGVADLAFLNGELYAAVAGGGCSHGHTGYASGIAKVDRATGRWTLLADVGAFLKTHPAKFESADDFEPDGTLYSLIAHDGALYAVEPNHGQVLAITPAGDITQLIDVSASEGHIVPTSIATRQGQYFVGNLNLFPIDPQWARILTISADADDAVHAPGFATHGAHIVNSKAGFTSVVALQFGPDGLLYALELSAAAGLPARGAGKVVRVARSGAIEDVVVGLDLPTGMTFGPDGALYISNLGALPAGAVARGAGEILRVTVPPAP